MGKKSSCVFPFTYNKVQYYDCLTAAENRTKPWCATTENYDTDKRWAYCMEIKCYRLVNEKKTFAEARKTCLNDGTKLASIQNEVEQAYVSSLLRNKTTNGDYWIGLRSPWGNEPFYFEDNTALEYTKWAPGKPGNYYGVTLIRPK